MFYVVTKRLTEVIINKNKHLIINKLVWKNMIIHLIFWGFLLIILIYTVSGISIIWSTTTESLIQLLIKNNFLNIYRSQKYICYESKYNLVWVHSVLLDFKNCYCSTFDFNYDFYYNIYIYRYLKYDLLMFFIHLFLLPY